MEYSYKPSGVCSKNITFEVENGIVKNVNFVGGCAGNTQGLARLCEGRSVEDVVSLLSGIKCGFKATSCPDQLAKAVAKAAKQE
ncbi:MAG: TIGR03905 family TSCPD domain-containing protein [Ruminococcaceae bacterium]|nr:TIGR03905 family TSCPD domain-containing protein [Oscillospiraceae bacterium]